MMKRGAIKAAGIAFVVLFTICAIVAIILAGIDFKFANPDWKSFVWSSLSALQIACIIYAFFVAFLGFCVFLYPKSGLIIMYEVLLLLSILFTLAIAIFALIGGSTGFLNVYFGCNAKISGIMEIWNETDTYLQNVDRALCSQDCPCYITNKNAYENNPAVYPTYKTWVQTNELFGATSFQNCTGVTRISVYQQTVLANPLFDPEKNFNGVRFANYMSRIENKFACTGWCQINYLNPNINAPTTMNKYLFTDINRGPPETIGCLNPVLKFLPSYLLAWGSVSMVLVGCQIVVFAMAVLLGRSKKEEEERHEEINRQEVQHDQELVVERH